MSDQDAKHKYIALTRPQHQSLADIAYNALVAAIVNQDFEPGVQLSIDGLAKQLAMSNTPVREALMRANGERLVRQKTNHGFVVAPLLTITELHQLFDVRYVLESHAISLIQVSNRLTDELERLAEQMDDVGDGAVYSEFKDYLLLDHDFHHTLVSHSDNAFLLKAWEDLHIHLHLSRLYTGVGLIDRSDSAPEHRAIVDALQKGDMVRAKKLLEIHISSVEGRLSELLRAH
ncbi:MAG: GntR family transcriptional regulator [Caldilineaceae bacterium]|nr:GntR family transcriptional regulator [Caldilineaceae bacterium]